MALSTFAGLSASVANFMNRTDASAVIPDFVTLAEAEVNRKLRVRQMVTRAHATVSLEFETVPSNFCGASALTLESGSGDNVVLQLEYADPDKINFEKSLTTQTTGRPYLYSVQGDDLQLFPPPDGNYTARMVYYGVIPPLSGSVQTNWLLTKYPDAYLYGALAQAGMWLRGDPRLADWVNAFETILGNIQEANKVEADAPRLEMPTRLVV